MSEKSKINRREFIKRGAVGGAAAGAALGPAGRAFAVDAQGDSPNGRVTLGFIGAGARAQRL